MGWSSGACTPIARPSSLRERLPSKRKVAGVPRLEPGYNPQGEWVQQLKLFALATGDGGLPVWFEALSGGAGDSPQYVPQFAAFCEHARLATLLPLHEVIVIGDRKMPTVENQLAWLRLGVSYIGPVTMQEPHRETLRDLLTAGQAWRELPYVAQRDAQKQRSERTVYAGLSHTVHVTDPESGIQYPVRHVYIRSSALATHAAQRRQAEMTAIEREIQRIQKLVNKYDYTTPEIIAQRVQQKAFKKRARNAISHLRYASIKTVPRPRWNCATLWITPVCGRRPRWMGSTCWSRAVQLPVGRTPPCCKSGKGSTRSSTAFG